MIGPCTSERLGVPTAFAGLVACLSLSVAACISPKREPWELAPLSPGQVESTRLTSGQVLNIDRVRFYSAELEEPRFFLALVPAVAPAVQDVFILNHGWWDRPEDLLTHLDVERVYAEMLAARQAKPAIIVLPDIRFSNSYWPNARRFPFRQGLDLVAEETAGWVSKQYGVPPVRDHWSIGGLSFGGYIALDVARRYGGRFGSASVVSAFYDEDWTFWPAQPPPPGRLDSRGRGKQTVIVPGPVPRLLLACGTEDRFFEDMTTLHERFTAQGVAHEWVTGRGGHTWAYWSSMLRPMLRFHLGSGVE